MSNKQDLTYFEQRMQLLGVTEEHNKIELWQAGEGVNSDNELRCFPVFSQVELGIKILVYRLSRHKIRYAGTNQRWKTKEYAITRLEIPTIDKKTGKEKKYHMPYGQPTVPFFPPALVQKYDDKISIPTLYITEGYFKAFKAQMHGIDCVGIPSITCMTDKETGKLHGDIVELVKTCKVQRLVWLTDGDCRDITAKSLDYKEPKDAPDLYRRPKGFFNTINKFVDLTSSLEEVKKYFAHINSDNFKEKPKGLDDLLIEFPKEIEAIKAEFQNFDTSPAKHIGRYIVRMDITYSVGKVYGYFHLTDAKVFYLHHVEKRPELKGKVFKFNGTLYKYNEDTAECDIVRPAEAENYFRVGDSYYQYVEVPDRYGVNRRRYEGRQKSTIKDDNGPNIFDHIAKFNAFCTVPDHLNYQRVINNCFNLYYPFEHEPDEGDCSTIVGFIKHLFGEQEVVVTRNDKKKIKVPYYQLGLDYIQLLYKKPQQILPILCLVSRDRQTGKTTFLNFLKKMFTENVAVVGNEDLANSFNSHWASKLIIACDETKIDKHVVVEKVKALSTGSEIQLNAKGKDQISLEFFGKFIFCSNNEDNFVNIDEHEIRFWVHKVKPLPTKNTHLLEEMVEEIPAFLHFLNTRQLVTEEKERHWFDTELLKTEALSKVQKNSQPAMQQRLELGLITLFEATELPELFMPTQALLDLINAPSKDGVYLKRLLANMEYKSQPCARRSYPKIEELSTTVEGKTQYSKAVRTVNFQSSFYHFMREDFINDEENLLTPVPTDNSGDGVPQDLPF